MTGATSGAESAYPPRAPEFTPPVKENETIEHIFWGCENVQNLVGQINYWFGDKDINQTFLKKTLIFGDVDKVYKDDIYNAILLRIKYYIYTNRCLKKKFMYIAVEVFFFRI
jgi:hypothetical protein